MKVKDKLQHYRIRMLVALVLLAVGTSACSSWNFLKKRPYEYGWVPKDFAEIEKNYNSYAYLYQCEPGETVASVGAGNGKFELMISCFVPGIEWYLEEIDSSRLYQFDQVLTYFEQLKGSPVEGQFHLVLGHEAETKLPDDHFDRVLMINVFHEITNRRPVMEDIRNILKFDGQLVISERMGIKPGEKHGDCHFPKLFEPDFLNEIRQYGFELHHKEMGEKMSNLIYYTFHKS